MSTIRRMRSMDENLRNTILAGFMVSPFFAYPTIWVIREASAVVVWVFSY